MLVVVACLFVVVCRVAFVVGCWRVVLLCCCVVVVLLLFGVMWFVV